MKINVTQKDIDAAQVGRYARSCITQCIIGTVLTRRGVKFKEALYAYIWWLDGTTSSLPIVATKASYAWVWNEPIKPFSFKLEIPPCAHLKR